MKKQLFLLVALLFVALVSWGQTITRYVPSGGIPSYTTIQAAINASVDGDIIQVAAGTYIENLTISKQLTLLGPNAGNNPNITGSRVAEAIILPDHNSPMGDPLISVQSNNVLIEGFYLDGDNPSITGGENVGGVDVNMCFGIYNGATYGSSVAIDHLSIENNIFRNFVYDGVDLEMTDGLNHPLNYIHQNLFENIYEGVYAINMHVNIADNVFNSVNQGIFLDSYNVGADPLIITNNIITIAETYTGLDNTAPSEGPWYGSGIKMRYFYGNAPELTVSNNTINCPNAVPTGKEYFGINIFGITDNRIITLGNNIINGENLTVGLVARSSVSSNILIQGGSLNNIKTIGVLANNLPFAIADVKLTIDNVKINLATGGIGIMTDIPLGTSNLQYITILNGTEISGAGATGIKLRGGYIRAGNIPTGATLTFSGTSPSAKLHDLNKYIVLETNSFGVPPNNIDATNVEFDGKLGSAMTATELFATEDKIDHQIDRTKVGSYTFALITVKANNDYVTTNSFVTPNTSPSVQRGIDAFSTSGTVNIQSGITYTGGADATVSGKNITLSPGASPGCVTLAGNMTLNSGDVINMDINGITACTDYNQFKVNGTVTLGGATLNLVLGFTPTACSQYTLINGTSAIVGQFVQGTSLTVGGYTFSINYAGGPYGFDVVLDYFGTSRVHNITMGTNFCTIQEAINAANPLGGDVINVYPGEYDEFINIDKSLTLNAIMPNPLVDWVAIFETVDISADNVTINGFSTVWPWGTDYAIKVNSGYSGYNISNIGVIYNDDAMNTNSVGIWIEAGAGGGTIQGNTFQDNAKGIYIAGDLTGVLKIKGNNMGYPTGSGNHKCDIENNADNIEITDGNIFNYRYSPDAMNPLRIKNFGDNVKINGNVFSNIQVGGTAISNSGTGVTVNMNSFGGTVMTKTAISSTVALDARSNWYGSAKGPYNLATNPCGDGWTVSGNVTFIPWFTDFAMIGTADGNLAVHNVNQGTYYCTIQAAINAANPLGGDVIEVAAGTFAGNIIVNKSVTIIGDPGDALPGVGVNAPVIDGGSLPGDAFLLANGVTNVTIEGFEMRNFTSPDLDGIGNGISAWEASTSNITIQDNYFHHLGYNGILVGNDDAAGDPTNWLVKNNVIENFGYIGIELTNTSNSSIEDNIIHLATPYIGAIFSSARRSETGLTVKDNVIDGTPSATFPVIYMYAYDLDMPNPNLNTVLIEGNTISTIGAPAQVYIRNIGTGTITGVTVINNNLLSLRTNTPALINAVSNYWGSTMGPYNVTSNPCGTVGWVTGNVNYIQWFTDATMTTLGYPTPAPTGPGTQSFCSADGKVVSDLTTTLSGTNIKWYSAVSGGTLYTGTELLVTGSYFASQEVGGCESVDRKEVVVTLSTTVTPTFNQLGHYCQGATADVLPTSSNNTIPITGTWGDGPINTSILGTTIYHFSPDAGQCTTTAEMSIFINTNIVTTFYAFPPYEVGATPAVLPGTSNNGITGTWYPAAINTSSAGIFPYTFTPDAGLCAVLTNVNITIYETYLFQVAQDIGTTLFLSWPAVSGAARYSIYYRPLLSPPSGSWIGNSVSYPFIKAVNLTPGIVYECKYIAYKPSGSPVAGGNASGTFTSAHVAFEKNYDLGTTCQIEWNDWSSWASSYVFQYQIGSTWIPGVRYANNGKAANLTPGVSYSCRVIVYRNGSLWGTTGIFNFTPQPVMFTLGTHTTTACDISWNSTAPWATGHAFYYRPLTSPPSGNWIGNPTYLNDYIHLSGLIPNITYECKLGVYILSPWGETLPGQFTLTGSKSSEVGSNDGNNEINVYPNPFIEQIYMDMFTLEETKITWNIYDMTSKEVLSGIESITSGYSTFNIDARGLSKGIYMLNAIMNDQIKSFRIMKQ